MLITHIDYTIFMSYNHTENSFLVKEWFIELTRSVAFNKNNTVLKPLNMNLLNNHNKLQQMNL